MKSNPEIRRWWDNEIIIPAGKYTSLKEAVEKEKTNLWRANLRGADLWEANLGGADLRRADLLGANLREADLWGADLREANLREANLRGAKLRGANLREADLRRANLRKANLGGANLRGANLRGADLWGANLGGADLREADLWGANLQEADLWRADFRDNFSFLPDLYSLKLLPPDTILRFWKYLKKGLSPYQNCPYEVGEVYEFDDYEPDERITCAKGGNVATLLWCLQDGETADEFIEVEFKVKDIVAIPFTTDGKFRVKRFKVIRKINRKQALGLLKKVVNFGKNA